MTSVIKDKSTLTKSGSCSRRATKHPHSFFGPIPITEQGKLATRRTAKHPSNSWRATPSLDMQHSNSLRPWNPGHGLVRMLANSPMMLDTG